MSKSFYITTTTPYVNSDPHIGFALEIIQADVIARYQRLLGREVVFNTGTDEHGLKIYQKAQENGLDPQAYCDEYVEKFYPLKEALNLSYTNFTRTTDPHHVASAQKFWTVCFENGDIYKKNYQAKYCVGCELEKTDSELDQGKCPIHPTYEIELIDEENYFFKFSNYQDKLLELYKNNPDFVIPKHRQTEIQKFVERGLQDFSISRLKSKMPWGVPVPGDEDHVMYVWFDALVNYISTIGWPDDMDQYSKVWPGMQVAGKDNLRQQTAMWQAMLMSAGLDASTQVFIHGFITSEGKKMSKSVGNVIDPYAIVDQYGTDPVRYFILGALPSYEDGDWSGERFEEYYTAHLANGIGNLTSRILTMLEKYAEGVVPKGEKDHDATSFWKIYTDHIEQFQFDAVVAHVQAYATKLDVLINDTKPWEKAKGGENIDDLLYTLAESLRMIALALLPFIPMAAQKVLSQLGVDASTLGTLEDEMKWGGLREGQKVTKGEALFPRL